MALFMSDFSEVLTDPKSNRSFPGPGDRTSDPQRGCFEDGSFVTVKIPIV